MFSAYCLKCNNELKRKGKYTNVVLTNQRLKKKRNDSWWKMIVKGVGGTEKK